MRKWALTISTPFPLIGGVLVAQLPESGSRGCGAVVIWALFILWALAFLVSVSRLAIAVCRKKLSYDAHADAALTLVIDSLLLFLLALATGPVC